MQKLSFVPLVLAVSLVTTIAFAANERKASGTFETLAASGVSGKVELMATPQNETLIHGTVRGLQPGTEYISVFYENVSCAPEAGSAGNVIARFKANPAGIAQFNEKVDKDLSLIRSISVQLASDLTVQACAPVTQ